MDKKEAYKIIRSWELRNGESFIEYYGDNHRGIKEAELMQWMFKKGYITAEKLEAFKTADYVDVCNCLCGYENDHALFPYGECDDDANFKAELIIAEYIVEKMLQQDLCDFALEAKDWSTIETDEERAQYKASIQKYIDAWDEEDEVDYNKILNINIEDINKRLEEEYKDN